MNLAASIAYSAPFRNGAVFLDGGAFAITNPEAALLTVGAYQEMIAALRDKLDI